MGEKNFKPSSRYMGKLFLVISLVALAIGIACSLFAWLISLDEGAHTGTTVATILLSINAAWWLVGMILAVPYYHSLRYEIHDDEVIVHVGIWTKSVKHVPFRTVTNIATKRDILDRWFFGIGSLNIQTAGMSGTKGAEESLVGLPNVHDIYDIVAGELRRFRGAMSPTAADMEHRPVPGDSQTLDAMLSELRSIRQALEK